MDPTAAAIQQYVLTIIDLSGRAANLAADNAALRARVAELDAALKEKSEQPT